MKPAAESRSGRAVAFSWEQEPGVSKQSPVEANKPAPRAALGAKAGSKRTSTPTTTKEAPAADTAHPHRLRVPPPPGGPGAPAVSPPGRSRPRRSRGVRPGPGDDPFLAAYRACTEDGSHGGRRLLLGLPRGLGLGYGLGLPGFGLSCKSSSCEDVEGSIVRLAKIIPPKITRNE